MPSTLCAELLLTPSVQVANPVGHTLYDSAALIERNGGKPPLTYKAFEKLMKVLLQPLHGAAVTSDCKPTSAGHGVLSSLQPLCMLRTWVHRQRR